jgi:hypothetical protein
VLMLKLENALLCSLEISILV